MAPRFIVVVDDTPVVLRTIQNVLTLQGHKVRAFTDSTEAIVYCLGHSVDLVITDMDMPIKTGQELIKEVLAYKPDLCIMAISGNENRLKDGMRVGARAVLSKPFDAQKLLDAVNQALDNNH